MANQLDRRAMPGSNQLTIYFGTQEPFSAQVLGQLFSALAADYKRFDNGAELVLLSAEAGSLKLRLGAIAAAATTVGGAYVAADKAVDRFNRLYDFGKNVSEIIEYAHKGRSEPMPRNQKAPSKSAQAILETAASSKSRLRLDYSSPDGERLILELDPQQVEQAHLAANAARAPRPKVQRSPPQARSVAAEASMEARLDDYAARRALASPAERQREDAALVVAIGLFVEALRASGSDYAVETVAQKLEARGLYEVAAIVRQELGGSRGGALATQ